MLLLAFVESIPSASPQSVGQETRVGNKRCRYRSECECRHPRAKASQSGKGVEGSESTSQTVEVQDQRQVAKAIGNAKAERDFSAADPPITSWCLKRSLEMSTNKIVVQRQWWNLVPRKSRNPNVRRRSTWDAFILGRTELELNSFQTAFREILPDEGQPMCRLVAYKPAANAGFECIVTRCSRQASDLSRQGAG